MKKYDHIHIAIGIPTRDSWKSEFGHCLANLMEIFTGLGYEDKKFATTVLNFKGSMLPQQRRDMVLHALDLRKDDFPVTHILFLDDDMTFPRDTLHQLLSHDKDIVAANCVTKMFPPMPTAEKMDGKPMFTLPDSTGLEQATRAGTGVMLVKRHVFEGIIQPWFAMPYYEADAKDRFCNFKKLMDKKKLKGKEKKTYEDFMLQTFNCYTVGSHGRGNGFTGEDVFFGMKAMNAGFEIWIDHDLSKKIEHIGDFYYTHNYTPEWRGEVRDDQQKEEKRKANGKTEEAQSIAI